MKPSKLNRVLCRIDYAILALIVLATLAGMLVRADKAQSLGEWFGWLAFFVVPYLFFAAAVRWLGTNVPESIVLLLGALVGGYGTLVMAWYWPDLGYGVLIFPLFPLGALAISVVLGLLFKLIFHFFDRPRESPA